MLLVSIDSNSLQLLTCAKIAYVKVSVQDERQYLCIKGCVVELIQIIYSRAACLLYLAT